MSPAADIYLLNLSKTTRCRSPRIDAAAAAATARAASIAGSAAETGGRCVVVVVAAPWEKDEATLEREYASQSQWRDRKDSGAEARRRRVPFRVAAGVARSRRAESCAEKRLDSRLAHAALRVRSHARGVLPPPPWCCCAAARRAARARQLRRRRPTIRQAGRQQKLRRPACFCHRGRKPRLSLLPQPGDKFSPPKLHHKSLIVSRGAIGCSTFTATVSCRDWRQMPIELFPRNAQPPSSQGGSNVPICFTTDGPADALGDVTSAWRSYRPPVKR